jgi:hypothetical protein
VLNLPLLLGERRRDGASLCARRPRERGCGAVFGRGIGYILGAVLGLVMTVRLLRSTALLAPLSGPGMLRIGRYKGLLAVID